MNNGWREPSGQWARLRIKQPDGPVRGGAGRNQTPSCAAVPPPARGLTGQMLRVSIADFYCARYWRSEALEERHGRRLPVPAPSGGGRLTEPTPAIEPSRRERVKMPPYLPFASVGGAPAFDQKSRPSCDSRQVPKREEVDRARPVDQTRRGQTRCAYQAARTQSASSPLKTGARLCSTACSGSSWSEGKRSNSVAIAICASARASGAPRQKCALPPKARCVVSARSMSKRCGSECRAGSCPAASSEQVIV